MTRLPVQHRPRSFFPELSELFEGFPSWASLRPAIGSHIIRVEDETKDGNYEVRAEIPGVDPAKDVDITVRDGVLTIKAERSEKKESNGRSEFSYGSFIRSVTLPSGADEDAIKASYDNGILTVSVPITEAATGREARCYRVRQVVRFREDRSRHEQRHVGPRPQGLDGRTSPSTNTKATPGPRRDCVGAIKSRWASVWPGSIQRTATSMTSATNWPSRAPWPTWPND